MLHRTWFQEQQAAFSVVSAGLFAIDRSCLFIYEGSKLSLQLLLLVTTIFDETSHLLLILRHNDCCLQLLTEYGSRLQWASQGVQVTPKLLGKLAINLGLEPNDFQVLAVPSPMINFYDISSGQTNEKSLYQREKPHSVFFSVYVHHVFLRKG